MLWALGFSAQGFGSGIWVPAPGCSYRVGSGFGRNGRVLLLRISFPNGACLKRTVRIS